jgi:hypothetical protein
LPCDPPVGGHSCNRGMIPHLHRAVCDKADSLSAGGSDDAKNEKMLRFQGRDIEQFPESKSPPTGGAPMLRA